MLLKQCFLGLVGISGGLLVSGGIFTVLLSVGLVPRFAGKTHTGGFILLYEEMVVAGTLMGGLLSVFDYPVRIGEWMRSLPGAEEGGGLLPDAAAGGGLLPDAAAGGSLLPDAVAGGLSSLFGLFAGIFVGSLALAIAEMLDTIPVFARRIRFRRGLGIAVLSVAAGKLAGSLFYFCCGFF